MKSELDTIEIAKELLRELSSVRSASERDRQIAIWIRTREERLTSPNLARAIVGSPENGGDPHVEAVDVVNVINRLLTIPRGVELLVYVGASHFPHDTIEFRVRRFDCVLVYGAAHSLTMDLWKMSGCDPELIRSIVQQLLINLFVIEKRDAG